MDLGDESDSNQSIYTTNTIIASPSTYSGPIHDTSPSAIAEQYQPVISSLSISEQNSRASSTVSLDQTSNSCSSPVTVMDVRTLSNNFQKMLAQATQEIKKLNIQKTKLEKEQEKLLTVNIELATEAKGLVNEKKSWKKEREVSIKERKNAGKLINLFSSPNRILLDFSTAMISGSFDSK